MVDKASARVSPDHLEYLWLPTGCACSSQAENYFHFGPADLHWNGAVVGGDICESGVES